MAQGCARDSPLAQELWHPACTPCGLMRYYVADGISTARDIMLIFCSVRAACGGRLLYSAAAR